MISRLEKYAVAMQDQSKASPFTVEHVTHGVDPRGAAESAQYQRQSLVHSRLGRGRPGWLSLWSACR